MNESGIATRNLQQYKEIHASGRYASRTDKRMPIVAPLVAVVRPRSILDYGSGKSQMALNIPSPDLEVRDRFDPAVPEISRVPRERYDMVTCMDVLEHLDDAEIDPFLRHIASLTPNAVLAVTTVAAKTILPNGENAHATIRPAGWWVDRVRAVFPDAAKVWEHGQVAVIATFPVPFMTRLKLRFTRARGK